MLQLSYNMTEDQKNYCSDPTSMVFHEVSLDHSSWVPD